MKAIINAGIYVEGAPSDFPLHSKIPPQLSLIPNNNYYSYHDSSNNK